MLIRTGKSNKSIDQSIFVMNLRIEQMNLWLPSVHAAMNFNCYSQMQMHSGQSASLFGWFFELMYSIQEIDTCY